MPSVKSSVIYPAQTLYFLFLAALKNYYVALLCSPDSYRDCLASNKPACTPAYRSTTARRHVAALTLVY